MNEVRSTSHIVRATGIIGAASLINIAVGLIRTKVVAVALGAAGVGRIGILISLMNTAAATAAWGISNTGARCLASASTDEELGIARRAIFSAAVALGLVGAAIVFAARFELARWLFKDQGSGTLVGWTALGVGLLVVCLAQNGVLTGLKRVGDLARLSAASAVITTLLTVPVVLFLREKAILPYVLLGPAVTAIVGIYLVGRISPPIMRPSVRPLIAQWRNMISLGTALTAASLAVLFGQLAIRVVVQRSMDLLAVGLFQASFAISVNYVGLALGALSTDYYPRLVPHIHEPSTVRHLINGQAFVSLLIAAPLIVMAIGFAPWLIALLYAPSFRPAAEMLRWQMLGDVMRIMAWPLSFVLLASGRGTVFALNEAATMAIGVVMTAALLPRFGIAGAGMAYLIMYSAYLVSLNWLVRRHTKSVWERQTLFFWLLVVGASLITFGAAMLNAVVGMIVCTIIAIGLGIFALRHLREAFFPHLQRLRWPFARPSGMDN